MPPVHSKPLVDVDYPKDVVIGGGLMLTLPACILLNSRPGGGKSHMARYLVYELRDYIAYGVVYSKSIFKEGNIDYIPAYTNKPEDLAKYENFRFDRFSKENLAEVLKMQSQYPEGKAPLCLVMIDDDISDPDMFTCEEFVDAITMFRHYNLLFIVCTQYINKLTTVMRECASCVGLFKMTTKRSIEAAFESYGVEFENYKDFRNWLSKNTKNPKDHNICWKDRANDLPWKVIRAPKDIPAFRLEYGQVKGGGQRRGGGKDKKNRLRGQRGKPYRKDVFTHIHNDYGNKLHAVSTMGNPFDQKFRLHTHYHQGFTPEQVANGIHNKTPRHIIEATRKGVPPEAMRKTMHK